MPVLKAGFARRDITQPLGSPALYGPAAVVNEIWDPLFATALYLDDGHERAVIVGTDLCEILDKPYREICAAIGKALNLPAEAVVVNTSHTHSAPYITTELEGLLRPFGLNTLDLEYMGRLKEQLVAAAVDAAQRAQPAQLRFGLAPVERVASNRRVKMNGKTIHRYGRPPEEMKALEEGLIDPHVRVVRFDDPSGNAIGAIVNYTCHPTAAGGDIHPWVSADFVGCGLRIAEAALGGAPCVFLQGTAGNVGTGKWIAGTCREDLAAMGYRFGCGILGALRTLRPLDAETLRVAHRRVPLALDAFPPVAELERRMREHAGARDWMCVADADQLVIARRADEFRNAPISAIALGELALAFLPGEVFVEFGLDISARSPFEATLVSAYNESSLQYIPTASAFPEGEYEVNGGWRYIAPGDGEKLADGAVALLASLREPVLA